MHEKMEKNIREMEREKVERRERKNGYKIENCVPKTNTTL